MSFDKLIYQVDDLYGALHVWRVFHHEFECHSEWVNGLMTPTLLKKGICWYEFLIGCKWIVTWIVGIRWRLGRLCPRGRADCSSPSITQGSRHPGIRLNWNEIYVCNVKLDTSNHQNHSFELVLTSNLWSLPFLSPLDNTGVSGSIIVRPRIEVVAHLVSYLVWSW